LSDPLLEGTNGTLGSAVESGTADGILSLSETFTYAGTYTAQQSDLDDNGIDKDGVADGDGDIDNTASVVSTEITTAQTSSEDVPVLRPPVAINDFYTVNKNTALDSNNTWYDSAWGLRRTLTFDNTAQTENLIDVPVLVALDGTRIDYNETQNDGGDLLFVDGDGTVLDYEIEEWNESGTSYVWVSVPQINGSSGTDFIHMYYGNSLATDGWDTDDELWNAAKSAGDHQAVWHLSETSGNNDDSTFNGYHIPAANIYGGLDQDGAGQIDGANIFDGVDDYMWRASDGSNLQITGDVTLEAWIFMDTIPTTDWNGIIEYSKGGDDEEENYMYVMALQTGGQVVLGHEYDVGEDHWLDTGVFLNTTSKWYHLTSVRDAVAKEWTLYVDGTWAATIPYTNNATGGEWSDVWIGYDTDYFDGIIDELRVSDTARSADWIAAQYASGQDTFVTYGFEQSEGEGGVLDNDFDPDGDPLTAILVPPSPSGDPANSSSFTLLADGSFTYTPNASYVGNDTFTYKANDGALDSNVATVTITVVETGSCSAPDPTDGFVISFTPPVSSSGVSVNVNPVVRFNQAMKYSTIDSGDKKEVALCTNSGCGSTEPSTIIVSTTTFTNDTVTIIPDDPLDTNVTYWIIAGKDVENACGTAQSEQQVGFTTSTSSLSCDSSISASAIGEDSGNKLIYFDLGHSEASLTCRITDMNTSWPVGTNGSLKEIKIDLDPPPGSGDIKQIYGTEETSSPVVLGSGDWIDLASYRDLVNGQDKQLIFQYDVTTVSPGSSNYSWTIGFDDWSTILVED